VGGGTGRSPGSLSTGPDRSPRNSMSDRLWFYQPVSSDGPCGFATLQLAPTCPFFAHRTSASSGNSSWEMWQLPLQNTQSRAGAR